ncbi:MAG TPA: MFS transporter [Stellaceae bacterium]
MPFSGAALLAPFRVRSFRFQWPADLLTSWGQEMENLVLSWFILVQTGSVFLLTLFWALQYLGVLLSPIIGLVGDRVGHRRVLCIMRAAYTVLASGVMLLAFSGRLHPLQVFGVTTLSGLIRPSDQAVRNALVAETIPADRLMATMGISRTTADSARIAGSLAGAGLFAAFGMGAVYAVITGFYFSGFLMSLGIAKPRMRLAVIGAMPVTLWKELVEGLSYVWDTPCSLAAMWLAFLVNLTAFPVTSGLWPYGARDVYHVGQAGLGTLIASFAAGSLTGSIVCSLAGQAIRPARMMLVFALGWYAMLVIFVNMPGPASGRIMLYIAGCAQALSLVPMSVMLLASAGERFRGRVMGVRMLCIYGVPLGLMAAGVMIEEVGFALACSLYCAIGVTLTGVIALRWRAALWPLDAPANAR